jgi:hypothetical protein
MTPFQNVTAAEHHGWPPIRMLTAGERCLIRPRALLVVLTMLPTIRPSPIPGETSGY